MHVASKTIFVFLLFFNFSFSLMAQESSMPVTISEYADFLNAAAPTDPHLLYHETMNKIVRTGEPGTYHYEVSDEAANLVMTFVTWFDAARYCNWKEHGSPTRDEITRDTTENGSYTLHDAMSGSVVRNPGSHYFLPIREEDLPTSLLANPSLHYWGANGEGSSTDVPVPLFHHDAAGASTDEVNDPTLGASGVGFYLAETVTGDQFNAASFLQSSHPDNGTLSTFDEVMIGVASLAILAGSGGYYAYYRFHPAEENRERPPTTEEATAEARREAETLDDNESSRVAKEHQEDEFPNSQRIDVITKKLENSEHFVSDERSYLKKWADWLRKRGHLDSVYEGVDDIECLNDESFEGDYSWLKPEERSCLQKMIYAMTQSFYPYKNTAEFLEKKGKHQQALVAALENNKALPQFHEDHTELIAQLEEHQQTFQQKQAAKNQARIERLLTFKNEKKGEQRQQVKKIIILIRDIASLEQQCYTALLSSATNEVNHHPSYENSVAAAPSSLTRFEVLRKATQYLVVKKLQYLQKVADKSEHAAEEKIAAEQLETQYVAICKADAELMERQLKLASKKELLFRFLGQMEYDFIYPQSTIGNVHSIEEKLSEIGNSIATYKKVIIDHFAFEKKTFEEDQKSNGSRESEDRRVVGSRSSAQQAKKKSGSSSSITGFFSSTPKKEKKAAEATAHDLQIETACRLLGERIDKHFSETVDPITNKVEKYFVQSYEMLHLAEGNALLGYDLMRLLEADQGKRLWETSSLKSYLVHDLINARTRVTKATELFVQAKSALVRNWIKLQAGSSLQPLYYYVRGGWREVSEEKQVESRVQQLKALEDNPSIKEQALQQRAQKIEERRTIAELLKTAAQKADTLLSSTEQTFKNFEETRATFLAAMEAVIQHPLILQQAQLLTNPQKASER